MSTEGYIQHQKTARLNSLDFLRGLFLIIILVNHIALFPNLFMFITGKSQLWMSAAEGFMAVSGLLIGYIYTRKMAKEPVKTSKGILRRALKVYIATILLGIFCMLFIYFIDPVPVEDIRFMSTLKEGGIISFAWSIINLSFAFHWAEFLSNYAIFIALAPLALWLIAKRKAWIVALISTIVWLNAFNISAENTIFVRSSWQIIFFVSVIIGAYLIPIRNFIDKKFSEKQKTVSLYVLWGSALAIFIVSTFLTWGYTFINESIIPISHTFLGTFANWWWLTGIPESSLIEKSHLGIIRLAAGVVTFWALFTFAEVHLKKLNKFTKNIVELTGKNGLSAYVVHSIIALIVLALPAIPVENNIGKVVINTIITALCIYLLYFFTHRAPLIIKSIKETRNKQKLDADT